MKIELKSIKYSASLSQETPAFTANIYVDGKKVGYAENHGQGGSTNASLHYGWVSKEQADAIHAYCDGLPPHVYPASEGMKEFSVPSNLEVVVDNLLEAYLDEKYGVAAQEKKWCKKDVAFRVKGDPSDACRTMKKQNGVYTKAMKDFLVKKYGENLEVILNEKYGEVAV